MHPPHALTAAPAHGGARSRRRPLTAAARDGMPRALDQLLEHVISTLVRQGNASALTLGYRRVRSHRRRAL